MSTQSAQRSCKKISPLGLGILAIAGCGLGYQETPIPPCFFADDPDPACQSGQTGEGSGTAAGMPTTGTAFSGGEDGSSSEDSGIGPSSDSGVDSSETDTGTITGANGGESTGPEVQPEPEILDMGLNPDAPKSAGPVEVTVKTANAVGVWLAVDGGEPVALEPVDDEGGEFNGKIAVLGESWNGLHTVSAVARTGDLESVPWEEMFTVTAPAAGTEAWKKKSALAPSYGNAVAADAQGEVYELLTFIGNAGGRCHVRRRDAQGDAVWPQDTVELAAGVYCVGEDIKVAPDGTLWVLTNTKEANIWRWQLSHLDVEGTLLETPEVGDVNEMGHGLDVNADGEVLLCGVRPGDEFPDAWVQLRPLVGQGWTVPWTYQKSETKFEERAKDCAFVDDGIVLVGEVFGNHEQFETAKARGFVAEFGLNGAAMTEDVAMPMPALQSGYHAVAAAGDGIYAVVGYQCDADVVPCSPTIGLVKWFSTGAAMLSEQPIDKVATVWDVAATPAGGVVVAAQASQQDIGFLVQAWIMGQDSPTWAYQGTPSDYQIATGVALGPFGFISAGGYYLDGNVIAAGVVTLHP